MRGSTSAIKGIHSSLKAIRNTEITLPISVAIARAVGFSTMNLPPVVHSHSFWDYALYDNYFSKMPKSNNLHGTSSDSPLGRVWNPFHLRPEGWRRLSDREYGRSQITALATGKKISSLQISDSPNRGGLPLQALTTSTSTYSDYRHLMTAYSGLRCLDIAITTDEPNHQHALSVLPELLDLTCGLDGCLCTFTIEF